MQHFLTENYLLLLINTEFCTAAGRHQIPGNIWQNQPCFNQLVFNN